jgi:hypothetical protein
LRLGEFDRQLRWSADGRELFYWDADSLMSVPVTAGATFTSGPPRRVFELPGAQDMEPAADGKRFLVIRQVAPKRLGRIVVALGGASEIGRTP